MFLFKIIFYYVGNYKKTKIKIKIVVYIQILTFCTKCYHQKQLKLELFLLCRNIFFLRYFNSNISKSHWKPFHIPRTIDKIKNNISLIV